MVVKITIKDVEYNIKELTYMQGLDVEEIRKESMKGAIRKIIELATDIPAEEIDKLSMKEGIAVQKAINKVNEFEDFQESGQQEKGN